jgi:DNA mismatch repair protein MutS
VHFTFAVPIDETPPIGGRLLKRWLALPVEKATKSEITSGGGFTYKTIRRFCIKCKNQIKQISDLERLISKSLGRKSIASRVYL